MAEPTESSDIQTKIWITSKVRMLSEMRYRSYGLASHILLAYYASWLILFSLFSDNSSPQVPAYNKLVIAFSVVILALSLVLYGFKFAEVADKFRECYLRLQRLYSASYDPKQFAENYHEILLAYPNHASRDYHDFIVQQANLKDTPVSAANGSAIYPSRYMVATYWLRRVGFYTATYAIPLIIPLVISLWLLHQARCL